MSATTRGGHEGSSAPLGAGARETAAPWSVAGAGARLASSVASMKPCFGRRHQPLGGSERRAAAVASGKRRGAETAARQSVRAASGAACMGCHSFVARRPGSRCRPCWKRSPPAVCRWRFCRRRSGSRGVPAGAVCGRAERRRAAPARRAPLTKNTPMAPQQRLPARDTLKPLACFIVGEVTGWQNGHTGSRQPGTVTGTRLPGQPRANSRCPRPQGTMSMGLGGRHQSPRLGQLRGALL